MSGFSVQSGQSRPSLNVSVRQQVPLDIVGIHPVSGGAVASCPAWGVLRRGFASPSNTQTPTRTTTASDTSTPPTGRFTGTTLDGLIVTHFVTAEGYVIGLPYSDYPLDLG